MPSPSPGAAETLSGVISRAIPAIFESEFRKLNEAQRQAVEATEGPVMVVAGPGTGKTQVVAMRVAHILRKTHMRPSNILCLTFSVSGATAMRERLRLLIGPDAYGVTVSTIHGFCAGIIEDHPILFDEWSARDQISDLERTRQLNIIIDQILPDLAVVNPKHPHSRTREILSRISQGKREGKTTADLGRVVEEYAAQMEGRSKPGTKAHQRDLLAARKFQEFTEMFSRYQAMLERTGRYDYEDMILYVIRALEREEWLLQSLQERYQYILVDEFQDLNGAQERFLELLTTYPTFEHEPNLFAVGDDDQAIYRFQGANIGNMLRFLERFPSAAVITLETSYRSTQSVLDAADNLIRHSGERLVSRIPGLTKRLRSASGEAGTPPVLLRCASDSTEPWLIADLLEERLGAGVPPREIAVFVRTNAELSPLFDVLAARGIPIEMSGKMDILTHSLVLQVVAVLRAVNLLHQSHLLAAALGCECFGIRPSDLGRIFSSARTAKGPLLDVLLALPAEGESFADLPRILAARDLLLDLHHKRDTRTVVATVEHVIRECGFLRTLAPLDLAALQAFFNHAKARAVEEASESFEAFVGDLELYSDPAYRDVRMTFDAPHLTSEGVQLMTAHQSKGLEFETVILVHFRAEHWDERRNPAGLSLPEDLLFGWEKEQKALEQQEDERRVAYVAMTRAKTELIFTCPEELTAGDRVRAVSPSVFFAEASTSEEQKSLLRGLPEVRCELKDPERASTLLLRPHPDLDEEFKAFLRKKLETYALSITAINHFLEDPQLFLRQDLLQMPQIPDIGLSYGNAVHWALKQWALSVQRGMPMGREDLLGEFRNFLIQRECITDHERQILLHLGQESLPRYYDVRLRLSAPVLQSVELKLGTRLGDIPITGRIDRIDLRHPESATAAVIDYKTGRPRTDAEIRGGKDGGVPTKGAGYFRQLVFYALLLKQARPFLKPETFVLDFVGEREDLPVERRFRIAESDIEEMRKLIRDIWGKMQALDFTPF